MRKLFTQLFSILLLNMVFVLSSIGGAPTLEAFSLSSGSDFSNHKKANALVLTAPEKVVAGTGVIRLKDGSATLAAYQANSSNVSITANGDGTYAVAVDFTSFLSEEHQYTLDVDANFVKTDDDGEPNEADSWTITEGDWTLPVLATSGALSPENGATSGVQLDNTLVVKFEEPVQLAAGAELYIYKDNGTSHGDLFDVVDASNVVIDNSEDVYSLTITPNNEFEELTKYYVIIPEGAVVDYNAAPYTDNKNKFAGLLVNSDWTFTTRDASAPAVVEIMEDNVGATSFDVFTKLDEKGKVYVMAVADGATAPTVGQFTTGNGMMSDEVTDPAASVDVSLAKYFNGTTGVSLVTGNEYDVYVYTETKDEPTVASSPVKKLDVTTIDVIVPEADVYYPANGETEPLNTKNNLYVVLSEDAKVGTGSVDIYTWSVSQNHTLLVSVPAASLVIKNTTTEGGDTLFIPVTKTLWASSTTYFVKFNEGVVTDLAGNKLAGINSTEAWKFTVKDFLAPAYTVVPVDGSTTASESAPQITVTFNETVYKDDAATTMDNAGILAAITLKEGEGTTAVAMTVNSFDGKVIKLNIDPASVASTAAFELSIDTKLFFDAVGNKGTTVDVINFSLKDYEGPVVTIEPVSAGTSDNILVKFDEAVYNANGTAVTDADVANMIIFRKGENASGAIVSAAYSVAADDKSFIINPTNDFTTPGDKYFVRLGAGAVKDAAGNSNLLAEQIVTVKDFKAPTAIISGIGTSPVDPSAVAPVITFSEPMKTLAGDLVTDGSDASSFVNLKEGSDNHPFTAEWDLTDADAPKIVIDATFNPSKTYSLSVGKSLQDVAENLFAGVSTTFTTWSDEAPAMVSTSPADDATEQANNVVLKVVFDQPIVVGTGSVTLSGTSATVGATSISGSELTIAHTSFVYDETVTVNIPSGFVEGVNGIDAPAVSWSFKTHETVSPTATYAPAPGSADAALDTKLLLTFDENIVKKTGHIYLKNYSNDVTVQSLTEANCVVKDDNKLEVTLLSDLEYGKTYYVVITEGLVEDVAGNEYAGITGNSWYFTAVTTPGDFVVSSSSPADEADKIVAGINPITVTFNRDIESGSASSTAKITLKDITSSPVIVIDDAANTGRFTYSGAVLTIDTKTDIVANKIYELTINEGIVEDNWGTPNTAEVITFYTFDNNGPKVISHTPVKDATNVNSGTVIVINWDETPLLASDGSAITAAKIKTNSLVTVNGGTAYTASINGLQWTLTLDAPLAENTLVTVVVNQTDVEDSGSKTQDDDYSWSFTTADLTCEEPTAFTVTENTEGTEVKFTVDFEEGGIVYFKVLPSTDDAPSASELISDGTVINFDAAGTSDEQTVTGLTSGASYRAYFVAVDASANANQSTIYAPSEFSTVDVVAPVVTALIPENDATAATATGKLKITFNEAVAIGSGTIVIRELVTDLVVDTIQVGNPTSAVFSNDDKTVEVNSALSLASKTAYYVEVSTGTFEDEAGNPMASISGSSAWSFTTKDTGLPELVETTPAYDAATTPVVVKGSTLSIEFNEAMKAPTAGTIYVRYESNDNVFEVINASALTQSTDKKTFSFNLVNTPVEQTEFWVDLGAITFTDLADNAWTNIIGTSWNFIIKDQTAPALDESSPEADDTGVDISTNIVLTFTEGIFKGPDATVFTATTIKDVIAVQDASGTAVAYTATLTDVDENSGVVTVTLDPTASLTSETVYTVYISPVVDILDNVSSEIVLSFTTKDMTAPKVSVWDPAYDTQVNPKTGVVTITFSEPIYDDIVTTSELNPVLVEIIPDNIPDFFTYTVGSITRDEDDEIDVFTASTAVPFSGAISADRKVITLTPSASALPLSSENWYRVQLLSGKVVDIADNANAADETIFRIEDYVKPEATSYSPDGPTAEDAAMTITFDEEVALGSGNIYVRNYVNGEIVETIPVNSTTVTLDDTKMIATIEHADFPAAMNFFATADAGTFTDVSDNANIWDGIATSAIDTWTFSTADAVAPGIVEGTGLYPVPGTTNVAMNTKIEIEFDKAIQLNDDEVTRWVVIYNEDWTPFQVIPVNSSTVEIKASTDPVYQADRILSISHSTLQANSIYYVRVMKGVIEDAAGNQFEGIMDDSWYFSTEDDGAPTVTTLIPADDETAVDVNTQLTVVFDRSVVGNAAGNIKLYKEAEGELGTLIETISPTSSSVDIDERTVTITLADKLLYETGYYVIIDAGTFTNTSASKIPFAGITTTQGWNFTTIKQNCLPIDLAVSLVEQLECSSVVNVEVTTEAPSYILTVNGDTIQAGLDTLVSGIYEFVAITEEGCAAVKDTFEVEGAPVVITDSIAAYIGEEVQYINVEAGIDTMLTVGVDTFEYVFETCPRTLIVVVTEVVRTPKIAEIQGTSDESPLKDKLVKVVGTVSGVDAGKGFYIQDENAAWSGIWVEYSQTTYEGIQIGNGVEVTGTIDEIDNVTTIVADGFTFVPPVLVLAPVVVEPSEVSAEKYEGVLLKVEGAQGTEADASGEWSIYYLESNEAIVGDLLYSYEPVAGHYYDVIGIVNGSMDEYKLEPRIESDVKDLTLTEVDPEQSISFKVYPNPFNDQITIDNSDKLSRVVVVNIAGQRVIDIEYPNREIRTANLVSGVYVISLYTESGIVKTERIIKR